MLGTWLTDRSRQQALLLLVLFAERASVVLLQPHDPPGAVPLAHASERAQQRAMLCGWIALVLRLLVLSSVGCAARGVPELGSTRLWIPLTCSAVAMAELELLQSRWLTILGVGFTAAMLLRKPRGEHALAAAGAGLLALALGVLNLADAAGASEGGAVSAFLLSKPAAASITMLLAIAETHAASTLLYGDFAPLCRADIVAGAVAGLALGATARFPAHALALSTTFLALALLQLAWDAEAAAAAAQGQRLLEYRLLSPQYRAQRVLEDELEDGGLLDEEDDAFAGPPS